MLHALESIPLRENVFVDLEHRSRLGIANACLDELVLHVVEDDGVYALPLQVGPATAAPAKRVVASAATRAETGLFIGVLLYLCRLDDPVGSTGCI